MATVLGLSLRAWQKLERDEGVPSGETLLQFEKLGVNPGWVLTGLGPRALRDWMSSDAEAEVFTRVVALVQELHGVLNVALSSRALAATARNIFEEMRPAMDGETTPEEIDALLLLQKAKLQRRLAKALAEPGTGKRSA